MRLRPGFPGFILLATLTLTGCSGGESDDEAQVTATRTLPGENAERILQHFNRGVALMERYEPAEAVKEFQEVKRLAPGWITGRINLGIALLNAAADEQHAQAEAELKWVAEQEPDDAHAHYSLGILYRDLNRVDDAIARFEQVLELHPEDADTHYQLAIVLGDGDADRARRHLEQTLALVPHHESAVYRLQTLLRKAGERERAAELVQRFQALKDAKAGLLSGMKYGEMGRFASVIRTLDFPEDRPAGTRAPEYADRAEAFGLGAAASGAAGWPGGDLERLRSAGAGAFHPGLAVADLNGDGRLDLCRSGSAEGVELYLWEGDRFARIVEHGIAARDVVGVFAGDADGDGDLDLYLTCAGPNRLYINQDGRTFEDRTAESGTAGEARLSVGAAWADTDHDGDLDLYVANFCDWPLPAAATAGAQNALFRNNGDGSFSELAAQAGIDGGRAASLGVLPFDVDGDLDLDLYVVNQGSANALYLNDRVGQYRPAGAEFSLLLDEGDDGPGTGALLEDFDRNGFQDLLLLRGAAPPRLFRQIDRGVFAADEAFTQRASPLGSAIGGLSGDLDLDGDADLVLLDAGASGALRHAILMNEGDGSFAAPVWFGPEQTDSSSRGAVAADLNDNGCLELVVTRAGLAPSVFVTEPAEGARWLKVVPIQPSEREGIQLSPNAAGLQVELKTGARSQIDGLTTSSGFLSSPPLEAHFGLGSATKGDYVRLAWPDGTLQSELEVAAGQTWRIQKISRKPSSCPVLFCFDGERFRFVTDFLGVGGVGFFVAPGEYAPPDPTESVRIPPELVALSGGRYLLRVVEPLEEVAYIDQLALEVYDHPAGLELYPDERFTGSAPFPTGEPLLSGRKIFPITAIDEQGHPVRDELLAVDRVYREPPQHPTLVGYAEDHFVELDFGDQLRSLDGRLWLYLYGWVEYTYSHVNYAAYQAGLSLRSPWIEVPDGRAGWKVALSEAGFPAGLPRMMTVDVTDLPLRTDGRLRIRTNMEVFVDQVFLAEQVESPGLARHTLRASVADLRSFGYPREYSPDGREPVLYDYERLDHGVAFKLMSGDYTRFGDVRSLLEEADDQFVIMGRGEEIQLEFDARDLPPLEAGRARTLVLRSVGYCKDMDLYTAFPDTVGPLPFGRMRNYPPDPRLSDPTPQEHPLRALQSRRVASPAN